MKGYVNIILNQMPPLKPEEVIVYASDTMAIFKAAAVFAEARAFNDYQFILTNSGFPMVRVDKKTYQPENNSVSPVNPDQYLNSLVNEMELVPPYFPLFIDQTFLQELAYNIFNKRTFYFDNGNFKITNRLTNYVSLFIEECQNRQTGYEFILQSLTNQIAITLLRETKSNLTVGKPLKKYCDKKCVNTAIDFLTANYLNNFSLDQLAQEVNYSPYHFIRIFKAETGQTPFAFQQELKINKAKALLKQKDYSITDICHLCGFNNLSHFTTVFRKKVGVSPSQYKKNFI